MIFFVQKYCCCKSTILYFDCIYLTDVLVAGYISGLQQVPREEAVKELLVHFPLLHSGNSDAKDEYLTLIPTILSHSTEHGTFIEESRQLLSYSLIHPAITCEERSKFNMWLGHLDERFSRSYNHSPTLQAHSEDLQGQGQVKNQANLHSPIAVNNNSIGSGSAKGQMPFSHQPENGTNSIPTHMALSKRSSVGSSPMVNGWNNSGCTGNSSGMYLSNDNMNMNGQGHSHSGSQGNLYMNGRSPQAGMGMAGHMPLKAALSAPPNFNTNVPPTSHPCSCK